MSRLFKSWLCTFIALLPLCNAFAWELPDVPTIGKIDAAPIYIHMDVLENGRTVHKVNMGGARLDGTYVFCGGWTLKSTLMGSFGNGTFGSASAGFGYTLPVSKELIFTPFGGISYTYLRTSFDFFHPEFGLLLEEGSRHTYKSYSPLVGLDVSYTLCESWRILGTIQYGWAHTRTTIGNFVDNNRSKSEGFAYGLTLEKDITKTMSINAGLGYNNTLSKEKHGLRGYGAKVGFVYWF